MAGFPSQFSVAMLPARTPAGRCPTAMHLLTCSGESPLLVHPGNSLASSGSILHPIVRPLRARSEHAASAQYGVRACALPISDFRRLEFRAEFFNVTNTAILNAPSTWIYSNLGLINSSQGERNIQFALKFY